MTPLHHVEYIRKKVTCCNCYKKRPIDPHHVNQLGMGRDRKKQLKEHYSVIPLCRACHQEYHHLGKKRFEKKHKIDVFEQAHYFLSEHIYEIYEKYQILLDRKNNGKIL